MNLPRLLAGRFGGYFSIAQTRRLPSGVTYRFSLPRPLVSTEGRGGGKTPEAPFDESSSTLVLSTRDREGRRLALEYPIDESTSSPLGSTGDRLPSRSGLVKEDPFDESSCCVYDATPGVFTKLIFLTEPWFSVFSWTKLDP
eukprot:179118_1